MTLNCKVPNGKYRDSRFCYQINTEAAPILSSTVNGKQGLSTVAFIAECKIEYICPLALW